MSPPKIHASPDPTSPKAHVDSSNLRPRQLESSSSLFAADPASLFSKPEMRSIEKREKARKSNDEEMRNSKSSKRMRIEGNDEVETNGVGESGRLDESDDHGAEAEHSTIDHTPRRAQVNEDEEVNTSFNGDENNGVNAGAKKAIHQEGNTSDREDNDQTRSPHSKHDSSRENTSSIESKPLLFRERNDANSDDKEISKSNNDGDKRRQQSQSAVQISEENKGKESGESKESADDESRNELSEKKRSIESKDEADTESRQSREENASENDDEDAMSESSDSKNDEAPSFLKEKTLEMVKGRLLTSQGDLDPIVNSLACDEDDIMAFMLKIEDSADKQTSLLVHHRMAQKALTRSTDNSDESSSYDEEDDEETARIVEQFRKYDEEQSLGKELFSRVVHKVTKEEIAKLSPKSKRNKKNLKYNILDKRTLGWVKKAAGIAGSETGVTGAVSNLSTVSTVLPDHPAFRDSLDDHGRRFTRGMAQKHIRKRDSKKKPSNHLDSLVGALADIEEMWGKKIPPPKPRSKKGKQSRSTQKHEHLDQLEEVVDRAVRKKSRARVDDEPAVKSKKLEALESNVTERFDPFDLDTVPGPVPAKLQDWLLRQEMKSATKEDEYNLTNTDAIDVPNQITDSGMVLRSAPWSAQNPKTKGKIHDGIPLLKPERREEYAMYCDMIFSSLSGKARSRARFEFFYSELDRGWFHRSDFVEQTAQIGIPPGMELTPGEWKGIRRTLARNKRPRRFSRKFVEDKRKDLERYRRFVRLLQSNSVPETCAEYRLDPGESVPSRIPVGAVVTAFNAKFRVLQRGVVLSYETARNLYLVRFPPGYGNFFCPDYEITRHGFSETFIPGQSRVLGSSSRELLHATSASPCSIGIGTSEQDLSEVFNQQKWKPMHATDPVTACKQADHLLDHMKPPEMLNQSAEREMLTIVLGAIENARSRKSKILECIRRVHGSSSTERNADDRRHYAWLLVNLEKVNLTLEKGSFYLRTLYKSCYEPMQSTLDIRPSQEDIMAWSFRSKNEGFKSMKPSIQVDAAESNDWSRRLLLDSEDICRRILDGFTKQHEEDDGEFIVESIAPIGTFLLASSYMEYRLPDIANVHGIGAVLNASQEVLEGLSSPDDDAFTDTNQNESSEQYTNAISNHKLALQDLKDAISDWTSEMAMNSVHS